MSEITCVLVGYSGALLGEMDKLVPAGSVCVVEEPDLIASADVRTKAAAKSCVAVVVEGPAQRQDGAPPPRLPALSTAESVIPGSEYTVVATAAYAHAANLPGAGVAAALALRDKARLRRAATGAVRQPDWALVESVDDVRTFRAAHGGWCVLKPTDRWASIGVQVLGPTDDLDAAWARRAGTDEAALLSRGWTPDTYLVEERLVGAEVSAELLVRDGSLIFANVTAKSVWPGRHPVESGHVVPAPIDAVTRQSIITANQSLIDALDFRTGAIHSEWILPAGPSPCLVECAGRLPGDAIVALIDLAYGCSFVDSYLELMRGGRPALPAEAKGGSAIRFLTTAPGRLRAVHGFDLANAAEGVFYAGPTVRPGETISELACSWDRVGHVVAVGSDAREADRRAEHATALVNYEVESENQPTVGSF